MSTLTTHDRATRPPGVRERESVPGAAADVPLELGDDTRGYSEFNFRRQPVVDATDREASDERTATGSAADAAPTGSQATVTNVETADEPDESVAVPDIDDVFGPSGSEFPSFDADVDRIVDRIYKELERKMRIERERRGL